MSFRYLFIIEYDGTGLAGWQKQKTAISIQSLLQQAAKALTAETSTFFGAGRTDAGVHALCQIAHADFSKPHSPIRLRDGCNHYLHTSLPFSGQISILHVQSVPSDFHARFNALERQYVYHILNRRAHLCLNRNRALLVRVPLDTALMTKACRLLEGYHDFSSFRDTDCQAPSPQKILSSLNLISKGDSLFITACAPSFLHHQVRCLVGTLLKIGKHQWKPEQIPAIFHQKSRTAAGPNVPPCGLYFVRPFYEKEPPINYPLERALTALLSDEITS